MGFALSNMTLRSPAFAEDSAIPKDHTGEGADRSPALAWEGLPEGTQQLAVICHDPDAPLVTPGHYGFVHWVLYNLPATLSALPEGFDGGTRGRNDFGAEGYGGPMPPEGHGTHRYYFWLLALDSELDLQPGLDLWTLLERVEPHVLGMNRLVGTYRRDPA